MLDAGCDPDSMTDDEPLLFSAQMQDRQEMVDVLLKHDADINKTDSLGNNVLRHAIGTMHLDMAIFLISHGTDVHAKTFDGVSIAYSTERALARMSPGSPGARKLERIIDTMKRRGVKFPADPPPKK